MGEERFNALILLFVHKDIAIDYESIMAYYKYVFIQTSQKNANAKSISIRPQVNQSQMNLVWHVRGFPGAPSTESVADYSVGA